MVHRAADLLRRARRVCVSSGAGMSAESGVPTFRDADGLWSKFNPAELATPEAFARNPQKVWEWYRLRRKALAKLSPHVGHRVLAAWESRFESFTIVTQNVDGLHHAAGSKNVIELHGQLDEARCVGCAYRRVDLDDLGEDPRCPDCGERLRPGVVWFGEMLPPGAFERACTAAQACDLLIVIGTSGVVQPAASLAEIARDAGAAVIEINPQPTPLTAPASVSLRSSCGAALVALDRLVFGPAG